MNDHKIPDSFSSALARARIENAESFIDPETQTLIALEDGMPGKYGMMVRSLRLEDQKAREKTWWAFVSRIWTTVKRLKDAFIRGWK
jgi:hypothetical protein